VNLIGRLRVQGNRFLFYLILFLSVALQAARFSCALRFSEGLAALRLEYQAKQENEHPSTAGGKWGSINRKAKLLLPLVFEEAKISENGRA
jgi:hypothetical protein